MIVRLIAMVLLLFLGVPTTKPIVNSQSSPPQLIHAVPPFINSKVVMLATPGFANLKIEIDTIGKVISSHFNSGHPLLMAASKDALSQWQFEVQKNSIDVRTLEVYSRDAKVKISPYDISLDVSYECPNENQSALPVSDTRQEIKVQCKVHKKLLKREIVDVVYGLQSYRRGFLKAQERYFPNDNFYFGGGCVIMTDTYGRCEMGPAKFAIASFCQKCRAASKNWVKRHKNTPFGLS